MFLGGFLHKFHISAHFLVKVQQIKGLFLTKQIRNKSFFQRPKRKRSNEKYKKMKRFLKKGLTKGIVCAIISNANRKDASLLVLPAGVAEQADARDLKSRDARASYRFDPGHRHQGTEKIIAE